MRTLWPHYSGCAFLTSVVLLTCQIPVQLRAADPPPPPDADASAARAVADVAASVDRILDERLAKEKIVASPAADDVEFLRRTGLKEVMSRHGAQYVNVTEAWWDGACATEEQVWSALGDVKIHHRELAGFVPASDLKTMLSFLGDNSRDHLLAGVSNTIGESWLKSAAKK